VFAEDHVHWLVGPTMVSETLASFSLLNKGDENDTFTLLLVGPGVADPTTVDLTPGERAEVRVRDFSPESRLVAVSTVEGAEVADCPLTRGGLEVNGQ
jgi:hypothetical protein